MQPWFTWNSKNSYNDFGLWINKLPPIVRAPERYEEITVPGRAGTLLLTEGEDVYDSYLKECIVMLPNDRSIQPILAWLRGTGTVVFSNEAEFAYEARIAAEVSFERVDNSLLQATIPFFVKPYKKRVRGDDAITITTSGTVVNPGDVASKPTVTVTGGTSVTIAGNTMTFGGSGTLTVDCENHIVLSGGSVFTDSVTGDFWTIPVGSSSVTGNCTIQPNWRWV